jgi:hypothetical protein
MINVTALLAAEGFAPRASFTQFGTAISIADAVAATIERPIARAKFVVEAAEVLAQLDWHPFESLNPYQLEGLLESANIARSTPCGSTEIWGCVLQMLEARQSGESQ